MSSPAEATTISHELTDDPPRGQKRKRLPRALLACESCRSRKLRCDQDSPCTNCSKRNLQCHYRNVEVLPPGAASGRQLEDHRIKDGSHGANGQRRVSALDRSGVSSRGLPDSKELGHLPSPLKPPSGLVPQQGYQEPTAEAHVSFLPDPTLYTAEQTAESSADGFDEASRHTQGTEPYPRGIKSLLHKLRSKHERSDRFTISDVNTSNRHSRDARGLSIGSLLMPQTDSPLPSSTPFSSDRQVSHSITSPSPTLNLQRKFSSASSVQNTPGSTSGPSALLSNADVEKECVRLYFQNLHLIHPILDQTDFIAQCETEIWARDLTVEGHRSAPTSKFLALFNAVLAIGAINAGDDAVFMRDMATIRQMERFAGSDQRAPAYPPLKLAKLFFERAKYNLGDVTEACSLENTQTLLLMTVFCQNALKPHSCYLYSGLAVRSALAIGLPNTEGLDAVQASMLWWNLYSFEIEMCASAGRESALREPEHYRLRLPHILVPEDPKQQFTSHMVALARIMAQLSDEIYKFNDQRSLREKSHECLDLDKQLVIWKSQLPLSLDFDQSSLVEPEWVSKQKIVLRNRFLNAKILLHRPFLIASANESDQALYTVHVHACVAASVDTIQSLYEMYKYRPYFRTWWYNTTYTLYASMILLYVVLTNTLAVDRQYAIQAVEKSLEIFNAMNMVGVARRCADITTEVLAMAKKSTIEGHGESSSASVPVAEGFVPPSLAPGAVENQFDFDLSAENPYASLVDPNIMDGFAEFQTGFFDMPDFNSVLMEGSFT